VTVLGDGSTSSSLVVFATTRPEAAVVPVSFAAVQKIHQQQSNAKSPNPIDKVTSMTLPDSTAAKTEAAPLQGANWSIPPCCKRAAKSFVVIPPEIRHELLSLPELSLKQLTDFSLPSQCD
jgi:hypothetical protein